MDYITRFKNQTHNYLDAIKSCNHSLNEEMMIAIQTLNLQSGDILLNAFSGGIPLDEYIDKSLNVKYLKYDTNKEFAKNNIIHYTIDKITVE